MHLNQSTHNIIGGAYEALTRGLIDAGPPSSLKSGNHSLVYFSRESRIKIKEIMSKRFHIFLNLTFYRNLEQSETLYFKITMYS